MGPAAYKVGFTEFIDYVDRLPRGAALETLQSSASDLGHLYLLFTSFSCVCCKLREKGAEL